MPGLGTIVNAAAVLAGGFLGLLLKKGIKERFRVTLMQALGLAVIFIGISGALKGMLAVVDGGLTVTGTMLMIISLVLGAICGEALNIERQLEKFGEWLKSRVGGENDNQFINAFVAASLTICIGAMAVVGSIEDGLTGDHSMLFAKALLDGIILVIFASAMGRGALFSVIPLAVLQGGITLLAKAVQPLLTDVCISNLSFVGSMLIFCVGVNIMFGTKIKVANLLPALIFVFIFSLLPFSL